MSDVSWMALALALTACGGLWTWYAWQNRGSASAVRGAAITLLPGAAWLTGTLEVGGEVAHAVSNWAVRFVFSPFVWLGLAMFVLSVLLFGVSTRMAGGASEVDDAPGDENPKKKKRKKTKGDRQLPPSSGKGEPLIDDDLADIEALLRKRGIS